MIIDTTQGVRFTDEITVRLVQHVGGDHMVAAAARVSTSGEDAVALASPECAEDSRGLIRYLMRQRHGTPFEHGLLTFFVHAPIFVWREWHRHRIGWSYNEESARYKKLDPVFWIPREDRKFVPVEGFKSARPEFCAGTPAQLAVLRSSLQSSYVSAYETYSVLVDAGYAREVSRAVLPVGTYSSCWATCNPRSLMAFLALRTHDTAARHVSYPQAEIEQAARQLESYFAVEMPITHAAWVESGRVAP